MSWNEINLNATKKQRQTLHRSYKKREEWDNFVRRLNKEDASLLIQLFIKDKLQQELEALEVIINQREEQEKEIVSKYGPMLALCNCD